MEIERKWLVDAQKASFALTNSVKVIRVDQYYLNDEKDEWQIRLRCYGQKYILDLKSKGLLSREELTFEITKEAFEEAVKHTKKGLGKNRHIFPYGRYICEIDGYDDYDFITCEVEFQSEQEANEFIAPDWCIKDITMDSKYKNNNLAK